METRANFIAVGIFTLAALVATFAMVFWFGRYGDTRNVVPVDLRIQGSVSGLGPGSAVQFNGITVGRVKSLSLDAADPNIVIVHTEVNSATPLRQDTRATIGIRGLSGGAFVQLEGGSLNVPPLIPKDGSSEVIPEIRGDPAALADLITRINSIAVRTERIADTLENFVTKNDQTVSNTLDNFETFSKALAENSDGVSKFMSSAGDVATSLQQLSSKIDGSVSKVENILASVDPEKISSSIDSVEKFTKSLANEREQIATLMESANETAGKLGKFSESLNTTLAKVDGVVDAVVPARISSALENIDKSAARAEQILAAIDARNVNKAIEDISATAASARGLLDGVDQNAVSTLLADMSSASKNVNSLIGAVDAARINTAVDNIASAAKGAQTIVDDVGKVTSRLGKRGDDIDQIVTDASQLASRLNESSKKINAVVGRFDNFLGSGTGNDLVADVRKTLAEFRRTSRNLDTRIAEVTRGITSFTGRGLADTQGLIRDARQSLNRIDRVIRNIESNPSSLISGAGGSRIRETGTRRPRR